MRPVDRTLAFPLASAEPRRFPRSTAGWTTVKQWGIAQTAGVLEENKENGDAENLRLRFMFR